jgi:hypothetical protein
MRHHHEYAGKKKRGKEGFARFLFMVRTVRQGSKGANN